MPDYLLPRANLQPSCLASGSFYACDYGSRFLGCCTSDPCDNGCPADKLRPITYNTGFTNSSPGLCSAGSFWYKCPRTDPPFIGCCRRVACRLGGCPDGNLTAATLPTDSQAKEPWSPSGKPSKGKNTGAIAGGVVGGVAGITLIVLLLAWWRWRRAKISRADHKATSPKAFLSLGKGDPTPMYGNSNLEVSSIQQSEAEILRMTPMEPTMPQRPQEVNSLPVMDHGAIELPSVGLSSSQGEEPRNPSGFGGHSKGQEERFNPC